MSVELALAAGLLIAGALIFVAVTILAGGAETGTDWCDHEGTTLDEGHVLVDAQLGTRWVDGIAPAYRCTRCLNEWTGAAEPLPPPRGEPLAIGEAVIVRRDDELVRGTVDLVVAGHARIRLAGTDERVWRSAL